MADFGLGNLFGGIPGALGGFRPIGRNGDEMPLGGYENGAGIGNTLLMAGLGMAGGERNDGGTLRGAAAGAALDQRQQYQRMQMQQFAEEQKYKRERARVADMQSDRQFNREPEAVRQMRALGITDPAEQRNLLYPKEGPTWGIIQKGGEGEPDRYGWINKKDQSVTPYDPPGTARETPTHITGPGGQQIPIPPDLKGKDLAKFRSDVAGATADAATGKLTETQSRMGNFTMRMENAEKIIKPLEQRGGDYSGAAATALSKAPYVPSGIGQAMKSANYEKYETAKNQWIRAHLVGDSGATIRPDEFEMANREFFPQPGEGKEVIAQKREARAVAMAAAKRGAGPGFGSPTTSKTNDVGKRLKFNPKTGDFE